MADVDQRLQVSRVVFQRSCRQNITLFSGRGLIPRVSEACGTLPFVVSRRLERCGRVVLEAVFGTQSALDAGVRCCFPEKL